MPRDGMKGGLHQLYGFGMGSFDRTQMKREHPRLAAHPLKSE